MIMAIPTPALSLYEFLSEAELSQYYSLLKNDLKVTTVAQLKYVEEGDLAQLGMSKPEQRRLRKYFQKVYPQTYLRKFKNMILPKSKDNIDRSSIVFLDSVADRNPVRVPSKHIIPADSIIINKELGIGEFGVVQQGVWTNEDGERIQVAIKCLSKDRMQNNPMEFLKEAAIMHTIDNEHIVRLYGVVLDTTSLMLVTELAPLRSLLECLKEPDLRSNFPVISLCDFTYQICDGMQYLESKRLIHRDLAARNILVFAKNKVKISDFGLSRALGVGKDYYQTNFNVNLKLPIAWCAPECINYLRFTSASDVWAYGVTLWEIFSYGFQPWAALTGQQILEAIDEPSYQRLEQPDCCPKEYYSLMLKCWQHDANKRPKFSDILQLLPECKPEQLQTVKDSSDTSITPKPKKDWLHYKVGDVITVLDKKPLSDCPNLWRGVLNSGKTGLFNPANTVTYLGQNLPTNRPNFSRTGSKAGLYSSKRRIRPEMISGPQGDLKHTGHVGLDGAFFGDISFLGDKYNQLPRQIVTPYKPQDDGEPSNLLARASSDLSDRTPLLTKSNFLNDGKSGPAAETWSDAGSLCEKDYQVNLETNKMVKSTDVIKTNTDVHKLNLGPDHEYHEISDEEDFPSVESPRFETLDFGPSLMDEVFKALGSTNPDPELDEQQSNENNNVRNEIKEITSKVCNREGGKKKQATVKPISAADQHTLDCAIAMAKELASRSMLEVENKSGSDTALESPKTPTTPTRTKFSFKLKPSPKPERRNFSAETQAIPSVQDILTEEAREAYNVLVDKGQHSTSHSSNSDARQHSGESHHRNHNNNSLHTHHHSTIQESRSRVRDSVQSQHASSATVIQHTLTKQTPVTASTNQLGLHTVKSITKSGSSIANGGIQHSTIHQSSPTDNSSQNTKSQPTLLTTTDSSDAEDTMDSNPLRMLRKSGPVRPKVRGNKHGLPASSRASAIQNAAVTRPAANVLPHTGVARAGLGAPPPPPAAVVRSSSVPENARSIGEICQAEDEQTFLSNVHVTVNPELEVVDGLANLLPLPPRDRSKPFPVLKQHQRRHPLVLPGVRQVPGSGSTLLKQVSCPEVPLGSDGSSIDSDLVSPTMLSSPQDGVGSQSKVPPPKPARSTSLDDSFETQIQAEIDGLDDIPEEHAPSPPIYKNSDHVSCEDLLEFALDKPNAKRTQGRARGTDSDEVRIMQKVLAKDEVTPEECLVALNETEWDIHKAIKYTRLQCLLNSHLVHVENFKQTLIRCNWNVQQAANYLLATHGIAEDTTEV